MDFMQSNPDDAGNSDGERIFYFNVGEGTSRNWDDCRQFGFLAAGGGRKWSKQLEKIKVGDTVIAYLKGYGYVGIGKVTSAMTPATKFMVNGLAIKELPLVNDTIRSIKRFSKENGEYLIGVDWQVAVPRENCVWRINSDLYTTPLVCASLANQPTTVAFVSQALLSSPTLMPNSEPPKNQASSFEWENFSPSLVKFLTASDDLNQVDDLLQKAHELHALCPSDLSAIDEARSIQSLIPGNLNRTLVDIIKRLADSGDEELSLFFIGICDLGDMTDEILENFLDLVDEGMNLSTLATTYVPHNTFEVSALVSLIYWSELPDWARARLVVRDGIGLTQQDRDGVIEYLGISDNIGSDTLVSIAYDISEDPSKYSVASIEALKAFLSSDFDAVSDFNNSDPDDLENHFNELGIHCIVKSRDILGLA